MSKAAPKHRAKREITRTVKPGAGGLAGSRDRARGGFSANPSIGDSRPSGAEQSKKAYRS